MRLPQERVHGDSLKHFNGKQSNYYVLAALMLIYMAGLFNMKNMNVIQKFVISLERVTERRENVLRQLAGSQYTIVNAVDGMNLTSRDIQMKNVLIERNHLMPGEVGCFLSHVYLWERIIKAKKGYTLVFEDDLQINGPLDELLPQLCAIPDFDIMYLGHYYERKGAIIRSVKNYTVRRSVKPYCTHAYLISFSGAKRMMSYLNSRKSSLPIDDMMICAYRDGYVRSVSIFPTIVNVVPFATTILRKR